MTPRQLALEVAAGIADQKGLDVRVLDVGIISGFTDYFVLATGTSDRHVRTLADAAIEAARRLDDRPLGVEGAKTARWMLVDLGDIVVHLFLSEAREFYGLERLWGEDEEQPEPQPAEAAQ